MDAHRHSTCISEPALLSNAQVKKRVSSLLRSVAFFLACPFRLEAVTKILTVCIFQNLCDVSWRVVVCRGLSGLHGPLQTSLCVAATTFPLRHLSSYDPGQFCGASWVFSRLKVPCFLPKLSDRVQMSRSSR